MQRWGSEQEAFSSDRKPPQKSDFLNLTTSHQQFDRISPPPLLRVKIPAIAVTRLIRRTGGPGPTKTIMNTAVTNILEGQ